MALDHQFTDDLPLYVLDALEREEQLAVEKHLRECSACRAEVEHLQEDLALLGLSASGPMPPAHCRGRLIAAVAKEPRSLWKPVRKGAGWLKALAGAAAAAAILIIASQARQNYQLRNQLGSLQARSSAEQRQLLHANELLTALTSANAEHFTLAANNTAPQPQARAVYDPRSGTLVLLASNMPAIPLHKAYELWLIPASGAAPIPAGVFKPNARGTAVIIKPPLPIDVDAKTFAITIEPETGSSAPSSQPIMVGTKG